MAPILLLYSLIVNKIIWFLFYNVNNIWEIKENKWQSMVIFKENSRILSRKSFICGQNNGQKNWY